MSTDATVYDVRTRDGIHTFYSDTVDDVFQVAARLTMADRQMAEDLVQDSYLRLVRAVRAGSVTHVSTGWLITVMRRRYLDVVRSSGREHRRITVSSRRPRREAYPQPGDISTANLLAALTPRERTALVLRYVEDLPVAEVADLMTSSVRAIESLLQRAKAKLRNGSEQ